MKTRSACIFLVLSGIAYIYAAPRQANAETPEKVNVCQLLDDRKAWDHKLIEVAGFASHGFEDSSFGDPTCNIYFENIWMEYGGKRRTGTMSTVSNLSRERSVPAKVEGVDVSLLEDKTFKRFDDLLHQGPGNIVYATVIARFFAGSNVPDSMLGYGHLGCCSLLMIQQVLSVDEDRPANLDYYGEPDQPHEGCFKILGFMNDDRAALKDQKLAESGERAFAFTNDERVARENIAAKTHEADPASIELEKVSLTSSRAVYRATIHGSKLRYMIVLNRPYWLSVYAKSKRKVAWVVMAAYSLCD